MIILRKEIKPTISIRYFKRVPIFVNYNIDLARNAIGIGALKLDL